MKNFAFFKQESKHFIFHAKTSSVSTVLHTLIYYKYIFTFMDSRDNMVVTPHCIVLYRNEKCPCYTFHYIQNKHKIREYEAANKKKYSF
jgi:hypothetical protein